MRHKIFFSAIFGLIVSTCSFGQQTINATIDHGGLTREYILYVPASYSSGTAVPLLFNFHGYTSNATQQMWYGDFRPIADTAGFIIVHPNGTLDANNTMHFNVGWGGSSVDDVGFTNALIDTLSANYSIDQTRIYSTGMSNGGFMSFLLACELSDRIAAIGSVTGSIVPSTLASCNPTHPVPVLQIHGTSDGTVPYTGGAGWSSSISSLLSTWSNLINADSAPITVPMPNTSTTDGTTVERISYLNGDNCSELIHYKITGGSHSWAGSAFSIAGTNYDIDASKEVWNFVSRYDINGLIGTCVTGVNDETPEAQLSIYPNPTSSAFSIDGLNQESNFELISVLGERVLAGKVSATSGQIDVSELNKGVYFLKIDGKVLEVVVE